MTDRLDEFDKVEWFDVARVFNRNLTWADFSADWDEFQKMKAEYKRNLELS